MLVNINNDWVFKKKKIVTKITRTCCSESSAGLSSFVLGTLRDRCDLNKSRPALLVTKLHDVLYNPGRHRQTRAYTERVNREMHEGIKRYYTIYARGEGGSTISIIGFKKTNDGRNSSEINFRSTRTTRKLRRFCFLFACISGTKSGTIGNSIE